jgi:hypothetical protein
MYSFLNSQFWTNNEKSALHKESQQCPHHKIAVVSQQCQEQVSTVLKLSSWLFLRSYCAYWLIHVYYFTNIYTNKWWKINIKIALTCLRVNTPSSWCINTKTCQSNFNTNFTLLICAYIGIIININSPHDLHPRLHSMQSFIPKNLTKMAKNKISHFQNGKFHASKALLCMLYHTCWLRTSN